MASDDECIAIALLHGCELNGEPENGRRRWCVGHPSSEWHPIEMEQDRKVGHPYFESAADLARAYCKFHNLLEPTDASA